PIDVVNEVYTRCVEELAANEVRWSNFGRPWYGHGLCDRLSSDRKIGASLIKMHFALKVVDPDTDLQATMLGHGLVCHSYDRSFVTWRRIIVEYNAERAQSFFRPVVCTSRLHVVVVEMPKKGWPVIVEHPV